MIRSKLWIVFGVLICTLGCNNRQPEKNDNLISKRTEHTPKIFKNIKDYPKIKDSTTFILELKKLSIIDLLDQVIHASDNISDKVIAQF